MIQPINGLTRRDEEDEHANFIFVVIFLERDGTD